MGGRRGKEGGKGVAVNTVEGEIVLVPGPVKGKPDFHTRHLLML